MTPLSVRRLGNGPAVILVHGGAGPELTWERQEPLAERWTLVIPYRRGYGSSPAAERQDFAVDAGDLEALIGGSAHLAGFSYGGLGAAIVAGRVPDRVRSLTLIEVPLFGVAPRDPDVRELVGLSDSFFRSLAAEADSSAAGEFLAMAAMAGPELAPERERVERLARDLRRPLEAEPDYDAIVAAGIPVLVVSGQHDRRLERLCDLLAERLKGSRARCAGAGHPAQRAPGFNEVLERFLRSADRRSTVMPE
jgi:pimeloyl-ACP methyl ester carboxylesterase